MFFRFERQTRPVHPTQPTLLLEQTDCRHFAAALSRAECAVWRRHSEKDRRKGRKGR
jgi:hypothetical protein